MYISGFFILFYFSLSLYSFFVVVFYKYIRGSSIRSKLETWWHCHQKIFCVLFLPILFSYSSSCHDFVLFLFHFYLTFFCHHYVDSNNKKKFMYWNYLTSWSLVHLHLDFLEEFLSSLIERSEIIQCVIVLLIKFNFFWNSFGYTVGETKLIP